MKSIEFDDSCRSLVRVTSRDWTSASIAQKSSFCWLPLSVDGDFPFVPSWNVDRWSSLDGIDDNYEDLCSQIKRLHAQKENVISQKHVQLNQPDEVLCLKP